MSEVITMTPTESVTHLKGKGFTILAIVGSRRGMRPGIVCAGVHHARAAFTAWKVGQVCLISGGVEGVDSWAIDYWRRRALGPSQLFPADWESLGKRAGHRRHHSKGARRREALGRAEHLGVLGGAPQPDA